MKTLAVIPARAGSKGVPNKNKREFCGKPLAAWAIECGKRTCSSVVVTSDDPDILKIGADLNVAVLDRPSDLAQDDTPMLDVLRHVLACQPTRYQPEVVVLLQPTQPLRSDAHVDLALDLLERKGVDSVVSVVPIPPHQSPDYAMRIAGQFLISYALKPVTRRQDCRKAYYRDGTVYAIRSQVISRGTMYGRSLPMVLSSDESCSIDTEADWKRAERMWRGRHGG